MNSIYKLFSISIFISLSVFCFATKTYAQFNACKDTLNTTTVYCTYEQDTMWDPVCGCDQHTYNSLCVFNQAHLLNYTPRACEEITIPHIYPNPASTTLNYRIYLIQQEDAFVYIYDEYGRPKYFHFFESILDVSTTIDVSTLPTGFYVMYAVANGHFAAKKFIKY